MKFALQLECDNAAFEECLRVEVARILRNAADRIEQLPVSGKLYDINGNSVGRYYFDIE
jgi:hypothetical protein